MPLLTSHTLILTHSLSCFTTSFLLLTNPAALTSSGPVWLLGEAMRIRAPHDFTKPSDPIAALALVVAVVAVVELVFAGHLAGLTALGPRSTKSKKPRREGGENGGSAGAGQSIQAFAEQAAIVHASQEQWIVVSMVKTLVFGSLVSYLYLTSSRGPGGGIRTGIDADVDMDRVQEDDLSTGLGPRSSPLVSLQMLNTRPVFVSLSFEMIFWAYLWTSLKEERTRLAMRIRARRDEARDGEEDEWDR